MLETLWESQQPKPRNAETKVLKPAKVAKSLRPTRLQLEQLESREVPSVSVVTGDVEADPDNVMQASQISAFFQQSALVSAGRPTTDPTVSWGAPKQDQQSDQQSTAQRVARTPGFARAEIESGPAAITRLQLTPGPASAFRGTGGLPRLSQNDAAWPPRVFAPYVDLGVWPTFDLVHAAETRHILYFNLTSVTADARNRPSWSGHEQYAIDGGDFDMALRGQIAELRALGGDVAVSFGGAKGTELALVIDNVDELKNAYRGVVDAYQLRRIDFDVEAAALLDTDSIERRSQAIGQLQRELSASGRKLEVWLTLPATRAGLTQEGIDVVNSALRHGVDLGGVNVKTSDANGESRKSDGKSGTHTIEAAISTFYQLQKKFGPSTGSAEVWSKIGVTPTIGRTDDKTFEPKDARAVLDFAEQQGVGMIGMWSLNRDQQSVTEPESAGASASGVEQDAFEFSDIFLPFTNTLPK